MNRARSQTQPAVLPIAVLTMALAGSISSVSSLAAPAPEPINAPANRTPAVWLGPAPLEPATEGIGRRIPDQALQSIDGKNHRLGEAGGIRGTIVVVRDPECPVSRRYGPRIMRLAGQPTTAGFGFVFIYPNARSHREQRIGDAETLRIPGIYVERGSFALAEALGVKSTGDVFVLDTDLRLRYRGAVDDQYGLGYTMDAPTRHFLRNALDALQEGREVTVPATSAPGCYIDADPDKDELWPPLPGGRMLS